MSYPPTDQPSWPPNDANGYPPPPATGTNTAGQYGQPPAYGTPGSSYPGPPSSGYEYWTPRPSATDPGLDLPWYGIGFWQAVTRAHKKATRFDGRASRGEYWWFYLWLLLLSMVTVVLGTTVVLLSIDYSAAEPAPSPIAFVVYGLLMLGSTLEALLSIPLTIRRLHDAGYSGWMYATALIPYAGSVILIILTASDSKATGLRFDRPGAGYAPPSPSRTA
ncbi:MAG: DUF805 domain-containing protein [Beutenbergiaceae bacterium]